MSASDNFPGEAPIAYHPDQRPTNDTGDYLIASIDHPESAELVPSELWSPDYGRDPTSVGARAQGTGTAFIIPSPDLQVRLMTSAHVTDGCLRIDLASDAFPLTGAVVMSTDKFVAMPKILEMLPGQPAPVTLAFRPLTDPMTATGTTLRGNRLILWMAIF